MKLIAYTIADVKVLKLDGEIETNEVMNLFALIEQLTKNDQSVVFDFTTTKTINTFIISALTKLNNSSNKSIILYVENNEPILEVLKVIRFTQIFTVVKNRSSLELLCEEMPK